jgi:hypothetical protein
MPQHIWHLSYSSQPARKSALYCMLLAQTAPRTCSHYCVRCALCTHQARELPAASSGAQQLGADVTADVTATSSQLLLEPVVSAAESIALLAAAAVKGHDSMDIADSSSSDSAAAAAAAAVKDEVAVAVAVLEQEELQPLLEVEATEPQPVVLDSVALGLIQVPQNSC